MGPPEQAPEPVISQLGGLGEDEPKHIASIHPWAVLRWHIWAILSLTGTAVLLWLNFSQYAIGGEIGNSRRQTTDILGTFQLLIKIHELLIVASLANIAHQLLIGNLLKDGIILVCWVPMLPWQSHRSSSRRSTRKRFGLGYRQPSATANRNTSRFTGKFSG